MYVQLSLNCGNLGLSFGLSLQELYATIAFLVMSSIEMWWLSIVLTGDAVSGLKNKIQYRPGLLDKIQIFH